MKKKEEEEEERTNENQTNIGIHYTMCFIVFCVSYDEKKRRKKN